MGGKGDAKALTSAGTNAGIMSGMISKQLFEETEPYRQQYYGGFDQMAEGQMPFGTTAWPAMFGAAKGPIESQYQTAIGNTMATQPEGGGLYQTLGNIESEKAGALTDVIGKYVMDMLQKEYGVAFQTPQTSIAGLQGLMGGAVQTGAAAGGAGGQAGGGICCFNFLEAEGEIYWTVRQYRDEHYSKDGPVGKGYKFSAKYLVPLMKHYSWFKQMVRYIMTKPLRAYASWYYGENRYGFIFFPFVICWVNTWGYLGRDWR